MGCVIFCSVIRLCCHTFLLLYTSYIANWILHFTHSVYSDKPHILSALTHLCHLPQKEREKKKQNLGL